MSAKRTKTKSEKKEELQNTLFLDFNRNITLTEKQKQALKIILNNKITLITGPAGTSKTFVGCFAAAKMLSDKFCSKIILMRATEIVGGSDIGALPGDLEMKTIVYMGPYFQNLTSIINSHQIGKLFNDKVIEFKLVQYIRGLTFDESVILIDECQNYDEKELMAIVTRFSGRSNCRMIFMGDINQSDINRKFVALDVFKEILTGVKDVGFFEFDINDTMRDKILIEIVNKYEKMKSEGKLTRNKNNS